MNEETINRQQAAGVRWDSHGRAIVPEPAPEAVLADASSAFLRAKADFDAGEIGPAAVKRALAEYQAQKDAIENPPADPGPGGGGPRNTALTPAGLAEAQAAGDWDAVDRHNARWLDQLRNAQNDPNAPVQYGPTNN